MSTTTTCSRPKKSGATSVDHGYAWIVLAACFLSRLLVDGFWGSLGMLLVQWELQFNASASAISWIGSSYILILLSSAPLSSALAHRFTYRVVVIYAGILSSGSLLTLSFVTELWQLYLIVPLLGVGLGLTYQAALIFFVYYFDKHFALANGLNGSASGFGFFIFAPFMQSLIGFYGWRGAMQITAAVVSNICVCGLLMRPPHLERTRSSSNSKLRPPDDSKYAEKQSRQDSVDENEQEPRRRTFLGDIVKDFDLSLFRNVRFIFQCILNGLLYGGLYIAHLYMFPHAVDSGVSDQRAAFLLSATGVCALIIRLCPFGILVDRKMVSASTLGGGAFIATGVFIIMISYAHSYSYTMLMVVVIGAGFGHGLGGHMVMVVVAYSTETKEKASGATAWFLLMCGVGSVIGIFISGCLYDIYGSYRPTLILGGVCVILMGLNLLADPLFKRWRRAQLDQKRALMSSLSNQADDVGHDLQIFSIRIDKARL